MSGQASREASPRAVPSSHVGRTGIAPTPTLRTDFAHPTAVRVVGTLHSLLLSSRRASKGPAVGAAHAAAPPSRRCGLAGDRLVQEDASTLDDDHARER